ncbi:hypothetical protein [Paraburkholderia sp. SIMBA_053]|uniref:hypothetical protein n=1 Tax=Paraburkholderia sp. SIMBA_053 TaxID=3085794 RepID=UPI00397C9B30
MIRKITDKKAARLRVSKERNRDDWLDCVPGDRTGVTCSSIIRMSMEDRELMVPRRVWLTDPVVSDATPRRLLDGFREVARRLHAAAREGGVSATGAVTAPRPCNARRPLDIPFTIAAVVRPQL